MSKRKFWSMVLLSVIATLMLACAVFFTACGNNETPDGGQNTEQSGENPGDGNEPGTNPGDDDNPGTDEPQGVAVTSVSLNKTSLTLEIGGSYTLIATVSPSNATDKSVTWSSTNPSVASVSDGKVTAKSEGTTTITATVHNGKSTSCTVTVNEPAQEVIEVTSVSLNKTSLTLEIGASETLTATVLPSNATDKSVTWTSSSQSVATVANGNITAVGSGTATITAKTSNGKTATCTVTVANPYADFSFSPSGNGYALTGYSGTDTEVTVPAEYMGKAVMIIDSRAFYDCSFITKIMLPDTIKEIGNSAFGYCTSLQTIKIPACTRILDSVFIGCTSLKEVTLPDGLISIGGNLFTNCNSLKKVTIQSGTISRNTFAGCSRLEEIYLGKNVSAVAQNAFAECTSLHTLTMPRVEENISFNEYYFGLATQVYTYFGSGADDLYPDKTTGHRVNVGGVTHIFNLPADNANWYSYNGNIIVNGNIYTYSEKPVRVSTWENAYDIVANVSYRRPKSWTAEYYYTPNSPLRTLNITDQLISRYNEVFEDCTCTLNITQSFPIESVSIYGDTESFLDEFSLNNYYLLVKHTDGWVESFFVADYMSDSDKEELLQPGIHTFSATYEGKTCEFTVNLKLHTFDDARLEDQTVIADGAPKRLEVTGLPENTEIIWENNGQTEPGEYIVTATLKKPYYEDKTLTAHLYIRQAQYNITYVLGVDEVENANPGTYNFGEGLTLYSPTSGAWEFLGWYSDADFTQRVISVSTEEYGDKTFYAKWRSIFTYSNGELTGLTNYGQNQYKNGNLTSIHIPSEIEGQAIVSIAKNTFKNYDNLVNVTIGNGVTNIGDSAFYGCSELTFRTVWKISEALYSITAMD